MKGRQGENGLERARPSSLRPCPIALVLKPRSCSPQAQQETPLPTRTRSRVSLPGVAQSAVTIENFGVAVNASFGAIGVP
jgi:hypothetical protein